jgi:hypothetical protein
VRCTPPRRRSPSVNLARWVTAFIQCWIFYDLYKDSRETILSFKEGPGSKIQCGPTEFLYLSVSNLEIMIFPVPKNICLWAATFAKLTSMESAI